MENRYETFTNLISKVNRLIKRIKAEEMDCYNLKSQHVSCLFYLYDNTEILTATDIVEISGEDKATISRSLEYLEENGYIECDSKTEKKYRSTLKLTRKGEEVGRLVTEKIYNIVNLAGASLEEKDRTIMYNSLDLICDNLEKFCNKTKEV